MKNYIFRIITLTALFSVVLFSCQKEEESEQILPSNEKLFISVNKTEDFKLNKQSFVTSKSSFTEKQVFLDGGFAMIAGQFFPTKIVGDQRWITFDYKAFIQNPSFNCGGTIHHSYEAAISLNGSATTMNFYPPANLVEKSTWRIPSWNDLNHLHHMVYSDEASIITGLNLLATGMVKYDGIDTVHQNPTYGIFWCSDFLVSDQGTDTWHLFGSISPDYVYLFQYQLSYPYAPIRLVQDVEPIQ